MTEEDFFQRMNEVLPDLIRDFFSDLEKGREDYLDFYGIEKSKKNYLVFWLGSTISVIEAAYYEAFGRKPSRKDCFKIAAIIKKYVPSIIKEYDKIMNER